VEDTDAEITSNRSSLIERQTDKQTDRQTDR